MMVDSPKRLLVLRASCSYTSSTRLVALRYDTSCTKKLFSLRIVALSTREPAYPLATAPLTQALCIHFEVDLNAGAVPLVLDPRATILLIVGVIHGAFAVPETAQELT